MIQSTMNPWSLTDEEVLHLLYQQEDEWSKRVYRVIENLEEINKDLLDSLQEDNDPGIGEP